MEVYIYTMSCPISGLVKYVGKTKDTKERFRKHLSENNGTIKSKWVLGLRSRGLRPVFEIIDARGESNWQDAERGYIKLFKSLGAKLLNQVPGGEGGPTMKGRRLTEDQRMKISLSKFGKPNIGAAESNKANKGRAVSQYDLSGNHIADHLSIRDAAKSINRDSRRIQMMLKGAPGVNHVGGFVFVSK